MALGAARSSLVIAPHPDEQGELIEPETRTSGRSGPTGRNVRNPDRSSTVQEEGHEEWCRDVTIVQSRAGILKSSQVSLLEVEKSWPLLVVRYRQSAGKTMWIFITSVRLAAVESC